MKETGNLMDSPAAEQTLCFQIFVYLFQCHVRSLRLSIILFLKIQHLIAHLHVAQSLGSIIHQQLFDQVFGNGIHMTLPLNFTAQYLLVDAEGLFIVERWIAHEHFVDENS